MANIKLIESISKNKKKILIIIIILAILLRCYHLTLPPVGHHSNRQVQALGAARAYYEHGQGILHPEPSSQYIAVEFQLVPYIISIFYYVFGEVYYIGRIVGIAFAVGTLILLFRLCKKRGKNHMQSFFAKPAPGYGILTNIFWVF